MRWHLPSGLTALAHAWQEEKLEGNIACVGGEYATASERAQGTEADDGVRAANVFLVCAAGAIVLYAVGGVALGYAQGRGRSLPKGLGLVERLVGTHKHARQLRELRGLAMDGVGMVTGGRFGGGGQGDKGATTGAPLMSDSPRKNRRASTDDSAVSSSSRKSSTSPATSPKALSSPKKKKAKGKEKKDKSPASPSKKKKTKTGSKSDLSKTAQGGGPGEGGPGSAVGAGDGFGGLLQEERDEGAGVHSSQAKVKVVSLM